MGKSFSITARAHNVGTERCRAKYAHQNNNYYTNIIYYKAYLQRGLKNVKIRNGYRHSTIVYKTLFNNIYYADLRTHELALFKHLALCTL